MYKTLLVAVDERPATARSIDIAARLASQFEAHVIGLFVQPAQYIPGALHAEGGERVVEGIVQQAVRDATARAKAHFEKCVKASGIASSEWRVAEGDPADAVALHARYADLAIINQTNPRDIRATGFADAVLMSLGRPALIVPYAGEFQTLGKNVLVAWNASREAARAVSDALPLLQRAEKVVVMAVDARPSATGHGESPGADIALYLARHGVRVQASPTVSAGIDAGNVIVSRAYDQGADLIVMGAYGHSRVREIVLGGATRTLLESMTVPVLMSH